MLHAAHGKELLLARSKAIVVALELPGITIYPNTNFEHIGSAEKVLQALGNATNLAQLEDYDEIFDRKLHSGHRRLRHAALEAGTPLDIEAKRCLATRHCLCKRTTSMRLARFRAALN
ncbi:unnamed protein product [Prorocentrum cordatum]|uniref:Uncharacterized protein n=1 Tax=Prorocentrum cordatum TaxID=2364126 RepID=A0ABN9U634_9DINO|nr:unnamed protein product [Polarella glacialis]